MQGEAAKLITDVTLTVNREPNLVKPGEEDGGDRIGGQVNITVSCTSNRHRPKIQVTDSSGSTASPQEGNMLGVRARFDKAQQDTGVDTRALQPERMRGSSACVARRRSSVQMLSPMGALAMACKPLGQATARNM